MRTGFFFILTTLVLWLFSFQLQAVGKEGAYLQAHLSFSNSEKILPRSPIALKAKVKNTGSKANAPGTIYARFAFLEPLDSHQNSVLFQTDKVPLRSINPGEEFEILFKTPHLWPSFFDYIREDWPMRQFEAVAVIDGKEQVIGASAVCISAHYYQGPSDEISKQVSEARQ